MGVDGWTRGEIIGEGAYGTVYRALLHASGGLFAVKQVRLTEMSESKMLEVAALEQEIELLKSLDHENIIRYLGCERNESVISIFLEFAPGGSVSHLLSKFGKFDEVVIKRYTTQVLKGLSFLHASGIVHRDIKGSNILVDVDGTCKLADFGCSKQLQGIAAKATSFKGTVQFMAPEVIRHRGQGYGREADIWSLGCTVVEMATGKSPWAGAFECDEATMFHVGSKGAHPNIPDTLSLQARDFLEKCFNVNPRERPTAEQLLQHEFITSKDESMSHAPSNIAVVPRVRVKTVDMLPSIASESSNEELSSKSPIEHEPSTSPQPKDPINNDTQQQQQQEQQQASTAVSNPARSTAANNDSEDIRWNFVAEIPKNFMGRDNEVDTIVSGLKTVEGAVKVVHIWGAGGIGKSSLAAKVAQAIGTSAKDIWKRSHQNGETAVVEVRNIQQIQLGLKGTTPQPLEVRDAMDFVIRTCYPSMRSAMAENDLELRRLYYSCFANKNTILLLDDAFSLEQVRSLLPRSSACVIVTSRRNLGLEAELGSITVNLRPLGPEHSAALLQSIVPRVGDHSRQIAELCGHLPLALRAVGSTLARRPNLEPAQMCALLVNSEKRRLELVETCIRASVACLGPTQQLYLQSLSVFPGSFDAQAFGAVIDITVEEAEDGLSELIENSLLEYDPSTKRYRLHDLLRLFSVHEALEHSTDKIEVWRNRFKSHVIRLVEAAANTYDSAVDGGSVNLRHLVVNERINIEAALRMMQEKNDTARIYEICSKGRELFRLLLHPVVRKLLFHQCANHCMEIKDRQGEASMLCELGNCAAEVHSYTEAKICVRRALALQEKRVGANHIDVAFCLKALAWVLHSEALHAYVAEQDRPARLQNSTEAEKLYRRCLRIRQSKLGDHHPHCGSVAYKLALLYHFLMDKPEEAMQLYQEAMKSHAPGSSHPRLAGILLNIGVLYREMQELDKADEHVSRALKIRETALGPDHPDVAACLRQLAKIKSMNGETDLANELESRAKVIEERSTVNSNDSLTSQQRESIAQSLTPIAPSPSSSGFLRMTRKKDDSSSAIAGNGSAAVEDDKKCTIS